MIFIYDRHFDTPGYGYEQFFPQLSGDRNIFTSNWDFTDLVPITTTGLPGLGNKIQSISPDGEKALITTFHKFGGSLITPYSFNDLDLLYINSDDPRLIKIASYTYGTPVGPAAMWVDNTRIIYTGMENGDFGVFLTDINGAIPKRITFPHGQNPIRLLYVNQSEIYWMGLRNNNYDVDVWKSTIDGSKQDRLELEDIDNLNYELLFISPDGKKIIWRTLNGLYVADLSNIDNSTIKFMENVGAYIYISSDSTKAILMPQRGNQFSEQEYIQAIYSLDLQKMTLTRLFIPNYKQLEIVNSQYLFPDARHVFYLFYDIDYVHNRVIAAHWVVLDFDNQTYITMDFNRIIDFLWLPSR